MGMQNGDNSPRSKRDHIIHISGQMSPAQRDNSGCSESPLSGLTHHFPNCTECWPLTTRPLHRLPSTVHLIQDLTRPHPRQPTYNTGREEGLKSIPHAPTQNALQGYPGSEVPCGLGGWGFVVTMQQSNIFLFPILLPVLPCRYWPKKNSTVNSLYAELHLSHLTCSRGPSWPLSSGHSNPLLLSLSEKIPFLYLHVYCLPPHC